MVVALPGAAEQIANMKQFVPLLPGCGQEKFMTNSLNADKLLQIGLGFQGAYDAEAARLMIASRKHPLACNHCLARRKHLDRPSDTMKLRDGRRSATRDHFKQTKTE